jgi:hypothetical protein
MILQQHRDLCCYRVMRGINEGQDTGNMFIVTQYFKQELFEIIKASQPGANNDTVGADAPCPADAQL